MFTYKNTPTKDQSLIWHISQSINARDYQKLINEMQDGDWFINEALLPGVLSVLKRNSMQEKGYETTILVLKQTPREGWYWEKDTSGKSRSSYRGKPSDIVTIVGQPAINSLFKTLKATFKGDPEPAPIQFEALGYKNKVTLSGYRDYAPAAVAVSEVKMEEETNTHEAFLWWLAVQVAAMCKDYKDIETGTLIHQVKMSVGVKTGVDILFGKFDDILNTPKITVSMKIQKAVATFIETIEQSLERNDEIKNDFEIVKKVTYADALKNSIEIPDKHHTMRMLIEILIKITRLCEQHPSLPSNLKDQIIKKLPGIFAVRSVLKNYPTLKNTLETKLAEYETFYQATPVQRKYSR